jgi:hypothetical protein
MRLTHILNLAQRRVNETLATKAGVDAHDQHQVNVVNHPVQHIQRLAGLNTSPALTAFGLDGLNAAVHVAGRVRVEADEVSTGIGKRGRQASTGCTIRCTSIGTATPAAVLACGFRAWQTMGPNVRLGT